jgi:hypothetical protein
MEYMKDSGNGKGTGKGALGCCDLDLCGEFVPPWVITPLISIVHFVSMESQAHYAWNMYPVLLFARRVDFSPPGNWRTYVCLACTLDISRSRCYFT